MLVGPHGHVMMAAPHGAAHHPLYHPADPYGMMMFGAQHPMVQAQHAHLMMQNHAAAAAAAAAAATASSTNHAPAIPQHLTAYASTTTFSVCHQSNASTDHTNPHPRSSEPAIAVGAFSCIRHRLPALFYRFLRYLPTASVCAPPPSGALTAGVLTLAVSYPCTPPLSATSNVLLAPSVIANISITVPAFAKYYGYNRYQIWLDVSLLHHRRMHPRFHYCTRRIVPFISLPVLDVPAAETTPSVSTDSKSAYHFQSKFNVANASPFHENFYLVQWPSAPETLHQDNSLQSNDISQRHPRVRGGLLTNIVPLHES